MDSRLAMTRYTLTTAFGRGLSANRAGLLSGRSVLSRHILADGTGCAVGRVAGLEGVGLPGALARYDCRNNRLVQYALEADGFASAVAAAVRTLGAEGIGVVIGTSTSGIAATEAAYRSPRFAEHSVLPADFPYRETHNVFSCGDFTRRLLGVRGPALVVSTACSSSAKAFATAARLIASGVCRAVVVGGVDSLCDTTLYGFHALNLLARGDPRPFGADRDGIGIGEAAGFALLGPADLFGKDAPLRLAAAGESADAYHMTAPHPEARGAVMALAGALAGAGWRPETVDYVHLHGTGTAHNDAAEDLALTTVGLAAVPASSTKGAIGHTLGAAGICGVVFAALAMEENLLPGTANTRVPDPRFRSRLLLSGESGSIRRALVNTFGFGGSNCCLALAWDA
ncbi:beta-ketoacyl-ACP synthase [Acidiferrobacter sp.]|uniref:beta-ketoacyl-ACP synthase n=1 Tax=Acidiferrobacter sp. TaxID=1872107 RepID=UPI002627D191|nr:beta-ketoacyl-ACP synthase [Acidiferrobacter sp.]